MLEAIPNTLYGTSAPIVGRLATIGGVVSVAAAAETPITVAAANQFGYLTYMRADCTVASTAGGTWTLRSSVGGAVILILSQPVTGAVVGSSYCWPFPVPWKTAAHNDQFTLTPSAGTLGTWNFIVNGFYSSI